MSGGAYDYFYRKIDNFCDCLEFRRDDDGEPLDLTAEQIESREYLRRAMIQMREAAHSVEWVDSGDSDTPADNKEIYRALNEISNIFREWKNKRLEQMNDKPNE